MSTSQDPVVDDTATSSMRERHVKTKEPDADQIQEVSNQMPLKRDSPRIEVKPRRTFTELFSPKRKIGETPTLVQSLKQTITATWLNVLLIFIPISWGLHFSHKSDILVFIFSFLSIIPLAKLLGFATEELSLRVGQTIGGLLNATLGNAVELIVAIIALTQCKLDVVQSSLVGSILSNILLVLGMCFFAGGTRFSEQGFLASAANLNSSLLTLSVIAVLIPAAYHSAVSANGAKPRNEGQQILRMSRGVSIILLFIYGSYLVFQLWSHAYLYDDHNPQNAFKSTRYPEKLEHRLQGNDPERQEVVDDKEEVEQPRLSVVASLILLGVVTILVAVTAEWLVDSIDGVTQSGHISTQWVGLILLPIVGNAAEHVTAVGVSVKDKLTLSLGVAVGSSIQIALFVIPFITILGWILNKPLSLLFDPFQSVVLFLSVLTVNYCVQDGKSNWLEGMILMCLYVIIGVSFWFYNGTNPGLLQCT